MFQLSAMKQEQELLLDPSYVEDSDPLSGKKTKLRSKNFTQEETSLLLSLVDKHKKIILCNEITKESNFKKNVAWEKITKVFNQQSVSDVYRTKDQLKDCWKREKRSRLRFQVSHLCSFKYTELNEFLQFFREKIMEIVKQRHLLCLFHLYQI